MTKDKTEIGRSGRSGRLITATEATPRKAAAAGRVMRDVLGPDGKIRRRISDDVVRSAIRDSRARS